MDATNMYFATWSAGWGIGSTKKSAIRRALENHPSLAKKIISSNGSLYIWTCFCLEDFEEIESYMPQCKRKQTEGNHVTKFTKTDIKWVITNE